MEASMASKKYDETEAIKALMIPPSPTIQDLKSEMVAFYKSISNEVTPQVDGSGMKIIDQKPDGFGGSLDYIIEAYMRDRLNHHFPGWSWEQGQIQLMGSEWVLVSGHLVILDEHLLAFGKNPPERRFFGTGAARIQFKTCGCKRETKNKRPDPNCSDCNGTGKLPHIPENVIDIDKNVKSANSSALKVAINRLCGIGDDVYRKRIDEDGMGTVEQYETNLLEEPSGALKGFDAKVKRAKLRYSDVFAVLEVKGMSEITDFKAAWEIVQKKLLGGR
jgi:hypothetical protein